MNNILDGISNFPVRHRIVSILLSLAVAMVGLKGLSLYQMSVDYRSYFGADNPYMQAYSDLQQKYSASDTIFVAMQVHSGNVFARSALKTLNDLTEKAWKTPYSVRVDSLSNFQMSQSDDDDIRVFGLFENVDQLSDREIIQRVDMARQEPYVNRVLVNDAGTVAGIRISMNLPGINPNEEAPKAVEYVYGILDEAKAQDPNVAFYVSGEVVLNYEQPKISRKNIEELYPILFLVMMVLLVVFYRSAVAMTLTMITVALAVICGFGLVAWFQNKINPVIAVAPMILLTLTIADCVHLVNAYRQNRLSHEDRRVAMATAIRHNLGPLFLTSVMTAIGFMTLNFSESPPYRVLGNVVALGAMVAFLLTITFMPAVITLLPRFALKGVKEKDKDRLVQWVARIVLGRPAVVVGVMLVIVAGTGIGLTRLTVNDSAHEYFGKKMTFRQSADFINDNFGLYTVNYSVPSGTQGGVLEPEYLSHVSQFCQWLSNQPEVNVAVGLDSIIKRVNRSFHGDNEAHYRIPDNKNEASQYLLVYELGLPQGLDLTDGIVLDKSASRVRVLLNVTSSENVLYFENKVQQWMADNWPENMRTQGAGPIVMFAYIGESNIRSVFTGLLGAMVIVAVILAVSFRSVKLGVISILSNFLPIIFGFGVWGFLGGRIDLSISFVLAISFGVVVDDTIHFIFKFSDGVKKGLNTPDAVRYALNRVGGALIATSVIIVAGFSVLTITPFDLTANLALLTIIIVAAALPVDIFLVPALLILLDDLAAGKKQVATTPLVPSVIGIGAGHGIKYENRVQE